MSDTASLSRRGFFAMAVAMLGGLAGLRLGWSSTVERGGWILKDGDI